MVSEDDVKKIANLARLKLDSKFIPVLTGHLNSIIDYMARLNQVDTTGVEPMSHVHGSTNVFREDVVVAQGFANDSLPLGNPAISPQEMLSAEDLLKNAPDNSGRFIRVPLIVE